MLRSTQLTGSRWQLDAASREGARVQPSTSSAHEGEPAHHQEEENGALEQEAADGAQRASKRQRRAPTREYADL